MRDTRALIPTIIGTGLAVVTMEVRVLSMQTTGVNAPIDDMRSDISDLWKAQARFEQRLDAVERAFEFEKVAQSLETLERIFLPSREPVHK